MNIQRDYIAISYNSNLVIYPLVNGDTIRNATNNDLPKEGKYSVLTNSDDKPLKIINNINRFKLISSLIGLGSIKNFGLYIQQEE